ncbi:MAG: sulfatase-like hydrolase/transferase [Marinifilaceae bacterium]|nr:sulfatase-like hydrolase/transferase [Marinifilaceae bacterium]
MNLKNLLPKRYNGILLFIVLFVSISFVIRTVLMFYDFSSLDMSFMKLIKIYFNGLFYDLVACSYFLIPFVIYTFILPDKIFNSRINKIISYFFFILSIGILVFSSVSEWFFWEEFQVRFNFIAVDYLVYTTEVISNIQESYPMPLIFAGIISVATFIFLFVWKYFITSFYGRSFFFQRLRATVIFLSIPLISWYTVTDRTLEVEGNTYCNELGHNGIYQIFSAFLNNELDYDTFYETKSIDSVFKSVRESVYTDDAKFVNENSLDITRDIISEGEENHYNIMMITVESLSARFMERFGNKKHITPFLDSLSKKCLFFPNFYANGTRTVRGMEALTLSVPPTPGYSIVKRPDNEDMHSLGNVLKTKGYINNFIYAGYGYFDNMNYFFGNNGYSTVDLSDFSKEEITFKNAWGVCDEDLFDKALKVADNVYKTGKPFHNFIMTTSNHRPFTYPEGKIDIPSHTGRSGAVKYTDYAIKSFIEKAKKHPWFDKTIFVIVADHCAGSAGETSLPVKQYHIPLFIYAPKIIEPREINYLCGQIDFAPTVLGLLNLSYRSKFYGKNLLKYNPNRALIGTYQKIGLLKGNNLTVQYPVKRVESFTITKGKQKSSGLIDKDLEESIGYYQSASYLYKNRKLNFEEK